MLILEIIPSGKILGATVAGLDLAQPLPDNDFAAVRDALGAHGVLRFPKQQLSARQLVDFSARFGKLDLGDDAAREGQPASALDRSAA